MQNPFRYGGPVAGDAFCDRSSERGKLRHAVEHDERLVLLAGRREGKTSLLRRVLDDLPDDEWIRVYVDLWPTQDATSFARAVARAVVQSGTIPEALSTALLDVGTDTQRLVEVALDAPRRIAKDRDMHLVVVFDDVQRVDAYDDEIVERVLRNHLELHDGGAYVFSGSPQHLVEQMFSDGGRPLHASAEPYRLGPISAESWAPYIRDRFVCARRSITPAIVAELCRRTGGHPCFTQHLAHTLWEITPPGTSMTTRDLDRAEDLLLDRLGAAYAVQWDGLARNQRTVLRGLASLRGEGSRNAIPFSSDFLRETGLAASSAHVAARALIERDTLEQTPDGYVIGDGFFRLWLRRKLITR